MAEAQKQKDLVKYDNIKTLLLSDKVKKTVSEMIPKIVNGERLLNVTLNMIRVNEKLLECTQASLLAGIMGILKLGLDPTLKQVHLVPYYNTRKKMVEAQMIIDYRGYIAMGRRAGEVKDVSARVVYEKDHFDFQYGSNPYLKHVPLAKGNRGEVIGAYSMVYFKDGGESFDFMGVEEIEKRMAISKTVKKQADGEIVASDGTPWKEWYEEMAAKTVVRHHFKFLPVSVEEMGLAGEIEDRSLGGMASIDFLPPDIEGALIGQGQNDVSPIAFFDEKIIKLVSIEEGPLFLQFLTETAELNRLSIDELKVQYKNEVDFLVAVFANYKGMPSAIIRRIHV